MNNICTLFFDSCKKYPNRVAIVERDYAITYADLEQQVLETQAYFAKKGVRKGDRVLVFVPMSVDLYRITLALFSMGATAVFLDEWVSLKRLKLCCQIADCKAFVAPLKFRFLGLFVRDIRKIPVHLSAKKRSGGTNQFSLADVEKDHPALITFTTGSVGKPKAAVRSHDFLNIQFAALRPLLENGNEREMIMLPIVLLLNLAQGKTSILADFKFAKPLTFSPERIIEQILKHGVQGLVASPYYLIEVAKYCSKNNSESPLKTIVSGGSAIFPKDAELVLKAFPYARFTVVFGSTEAEPISHCDARELIAHRNETGVFVGQIDPFAEVKILDYHGVLEHRCSDAEFENKLASTGQTGEILVSGKHVLTSYLDGEEILIKNKIVTPTAMLHRTGDAGYLNDRGELFLMGRVHQILEFDDVTVFPFVAEKLIREVDGVALGTLVSLNEQPVLVYQANGEVKEEELRAKFEQIRALTVVRIEEIPVDPRHRSKIEYARLLEILKKRKS